MVGFDASPASVDAARWAAGWASKHGRGVALVAVLDLYGAWSIAQEALRDQFRAERRLKCREALTRVGLYDRVDEVTSHLSGGERQRVAIARAIAKGSDVLFVDEPTASLDVDNCNLVYDLLRELADGGALVLIATHDVALVSRCDEEVPVSAHRS